MTRKRRLTKALKAKMSEDYLYLQGALVEIFEVMNYNLLYDDENYYNEKFERLKEFLDNEIYM